MAPKSVSEKLLGGDQTPTEAGDKKKDDTTPTPVVDKEVTPSEDDKKKKDTHSTTKKGSTSRSSRGTNLTELTELSPSEGSSRRGLAKRKDMAGLRKGGSSRGAGGLKKKTKQNMKIMNLKLKHLRKAQAKKFSSHPRSFSGNIMKILRSVNEGLANDHSYPAKRVNQLSMMIFDSFANDLCDKLIGSAVELMKNSDKKQLGSSEIKAAMKLVLPYDMAVCCEEAVQVSLASYKEHTKKYQLKIAKAKGNKKVAAGTKKD